MRDYDNNALDFFRMIATIQVFGGHIITHLVPSPPPWMEFYGILSILSVVYPFCSSSAGSWLQSLWNIAILKNG